MRHQDFLLASKLCLISFISCAFPILLLRPYLAQRHQWRANSHICRFGSRVYPSGRVGVYMRLFHLGRRQCRRGASRGGIWPHLDFCWRRRAAQTRRAWRQRHDVGGRPQLSYDLESVNRRGKRRKEKKRKREGGS